MSRCRKDVATCQQDNASLAVNSVYASRPKTQDRKVRGVSGRRQSDQSDNISQHDISQRLNNLVLYQKQKTEELGLTNDKSLYDSKGDPKWLAFIGRNYEAE